jgi:hypothetical protein
MKNLQNRLDSSVKALSRAALCFIVLSICGYSGSTFAQSASYGAKGPNSTSSQLLPELLPREKEIELALSAAPEHLRKAAGVYVLERNGFVKARESTNGFTCIVNRDHPLSLKPVCFDAEGTATILPKILRVGELLMQGVPMSQIDQGNRGRIPHRQVHLATSGWCRLHAFRRHSQLQPAYGKG